MFKAKEHMQTVKLLLHCVKLRLIWYNWENTCVKTHIIWPCSLWRLADANDGRFSSFLKNLSFSLHLPVSLFIFSRTSIVHLERAAYAHMCVYNNLKIAGEITTQSPYQHFVGSVVSH